MIAIQCRACGQEFKSDNRNVRHYGNCCGSRMHMAGRRATGRVALAIQRGELPPPRTTECVDCGRPAEVYDHRDYLQPLKVDAVCRRCNYRRGPAVPEQEAA